MSTAATDRMLARRRAKKMRRDARRRARLAVRRIVETVHVQEAPAPPRPSWWRRLLAWLRARMGW